jgi:ABC-2 type transport system ATP-binding protein
MKQRLSIAIALCSDPEFIVLDEPMNGLDPEGIVQVRELIKSLSTNKKITFLISSHLLAELSKIANRYGIIHKGKLLSEFTKEELLNSLASNTKIQTSNNELALVLLKQAEYNVKQLGEFLIISGNLVSSKLVSLLGVNNIDITSYMVEQENIEDYYLKQIGAI